MDEGKRFESNFKDSCKLSDGIEIVRLYDTTSGYAGIKNPCDFIVYKFPIMLMAELKSCKEDTFYFSRISDAQLVGLSKACKLQGIAAGIIIQYRSTKECFYVDMNKVLELMDEGKAGVKLTLAREIGLSLPILEKKRVNDIFDMPTFMSALENFEGVV